MRSAELPRRRFYYGWVVVGAGFILTSTFSTIFNSYGVFFKPLAVDFGWSRATTSALQSTAFVSAAIFSVIMGSLVDRIGQFKVLVMCGILAGAGLILTSQASSTWQMFVTYGLMVGVGLSSIFSLTGTATARWFVERRGLALGLTSSGFGFGSLIGVPLVAQLIATVGWSTSYLILGLAAFTIMVSAANFFKFNPVIASSLDIL